MELRHLRYFIAVAEELHFGRAAKRLGISQPPLSQQIRSLEDQLGVELLRRTRRSVRMTSAGEVFLEAARRILRGVEDSVEVARRAARGEVGTLNVGYAPGVEIEILPRVLHAFARRYPAVDLRLSPLHSREQMEALRQRAIDVGFVRLPLTGEDLRIEPIHREPLVLVAPRGHPLARRRSLRLRDLAGISYIHLARAYSPVFHDLISSLAREAGVALRVVTESSHLYDNLSLVAAGVGVSLLPSSVQRIRRKGVIYRPIGPARLMVGVGLAHRKNELSQVPLAFIGIVRSLYARGR